MIDTPGLRKSWDAVVQHGDQVPLFFYSTLFLTEPAIREMFPVSMAGQRDKLVQALGRIVSEVDDLDALAPYLQGLGRDHRRFAVSRDHYPAIGSALLATLAHFSGPDWSDELARDWSAAYNRVAQVMIDSAEAASSETPPWWDAEIIDVERRTIDVAVLRVRPTVPLPYAAGQSMAVETPLRPRLWRYYTPATLPDATGAFELHIRLVPGGAVSHSLVHGTQVGDVLRFGAPVGHDLTLEGAGRDLVLLAGGTGLAPMKAIIEQVAAEGGNRRILLLWGAAYHRDLYDLVAMAGLAREAPWLRLVPCVSHERSFSTAVMTGSVADVIVRSGVLSDQQIYLCGSPEMVRSTVKALTEAGTPMAALRIEQFGSEETAT